MNLSSTLTEKFPDQDINKKIVFYWDNDKNSEIINSNTADMNIVNQFYSELYKPIHYMIKLIDTGYFNSNHFIKKFSFIKKDADIFLEFEFPSNRTIQESRVVNLYERAPNTQFMSKISKLEDEVVVATKFSENSKKFLLIFFSCDDKLFRSGILRQSIFRKE